MNFVIKYFQKRNNNIIANLDYELAEECWKAIEALEDEFKKGIKSQDRSYPELMHLEGIFLDLTDRTQAHPRVPFGTEERGGFFENFVKDLGFRNRKVVWRFTEMFNVDKYIKDDWFVSTLETYNEYFEDMKKAKELYVSRRINFLEYFFKRLEIYNFIEPSKHHKYYKNVDMIKYKDNLRKIFKNLPSMTREGQFDI